MRLSCRRPPGCRTAHPTLSVPDRHTTLDRAAHPTYPGSRTRWSPQGHLVPRAGRQRARARACVRADSVPPAAAPPRLNSPPARPPARPLAPLPAPYGAHPMVPTYAISEEVNPIGSMPLVTPSSALYCPAPGQIGLGCSRQPSSTLGAAHCTWSCASGSSTGGSRSQEHQAGQSSVALSGLAQLRCSQNG
jgi:hypothetical protein